MGEQRSICHSKKFVRIDAHRSAARAPIATPVPIVSLAVATALPPRAIDPATGWAISSIIGAALYIGLCE